jgi:hypothetical protein
MNFDRPTRLKLLVFPKGGYDSWTKQERSLMEAHARAFAGEYVKDFSAWDACTRLGYTEEDLKKRKIHLKYMRHWLVCSYVDQLQSKFESHGLATRDRLLSLVYRDASDFSPRADSRARAAAQKTLMELLGEGSTTKNINAKVGTAAGGVMIVNGLSEEAWEAKAAETQRKLKEDVRGD